MRFIKNIATDAIIIWPLIYFGLFLQMEYVCNIVLAFLWFISIGGLIGALSCIASDELMRKYREKHKRQSFIHKWYQIITSIAEIAAIFAFGYFWLGGFYLLAMIFIWSLKQKAEEA